MAENLTVDDGGEGIYHNPDNDEYYYTWDAAMRVAKSILGWHLPTSLEWNEVALACGATEKPYEDDPNYRDYEDAQELQKKLNMKLAGAHHASFYGDGTYYDKLYGVGSFVRFWTSTEYSSTFAYHHYFRTGTPMDSYYDKNYGYSVRLVKDN